MGPYWLGPAAGVISRSPAAVAGLLVVTVTVGGWRSDRERKLWTAPGWIGGGGKPGRASVLRGVEDQAAFQAGLNNEVTANGLLKMLRLIADGKAYSQKACEEMLNIMLEQQYRSGIPAGLPKAARVAHKTGNISTVHHDAGIVYLEGRKPYVLVILTQFRAETGRGTAVAEVSRDIFNTLAGTNYESQS